ncbi:unnamed protein product [Lepeophtheirus salmonis]|uniref:(salmon louse) hypothetical protein n=1 Tax=Lepeophtheirus salmonis TaxID=72036 RepID=A0A7R8H1H8_LEPSM|nr:unnamed protein product [Lepeophtheirus salmonis]CAF2794164.1 unnamed protein product [Lepeophtheirus salmonis]
MASFKYICLIALIGSAAASGGPRPRARTLTVNRAGKSLLNTFPFNDGARGTARAAHAEHHEHEHAHAEHPAASDNRLARQGGGDDVPLDIGSIAAAGERCIDKVVMRCHTTYTTDFEPQQEEECEENFEKSCFIEYKKVAVDETVKFCHTPLVCEGEGPEECKTVYESECETKYHEHDVEDDVVNCETIQEEKCEDVTQVCTNEKKNVKKYSPQTECKKVPRQLCGPSGCVPQPGPEECFDKKETIVQEVPEENCNLEPQKSCKQITKLVPSLKPVKECVDIPKEVCSHSRKNPRKVQKPVVKKWCYVPSAASGLAA